MAFFRRKPPDVIDGLHLVVGLGNPGPRYAGTRHNVGAQAVETMTERHGLRLQKSKHAARVARGAEPAPVIFAVPDTFMNESGIAVARLMRYFKVQPHRLLVLCDDIDIPFGTIRIRPDGSSGGNNGLKSIVQSIGTQAFPRLRFGVGRPVHGAVDHVLGKFPPEQELLLPRLLDLGDQAVTCILSQGVREAMNQFNRDWLQAEIVGADHPTD